MTLKRRDFLKKAATVVGGATLAGCGNKEQKASADSPTVHTTGKTYEWKMVTAWPPHYPILGESADKLAKWIEEMSAGRMKIQVYGGGELVPALESFDAVTSGVAEMGHGASYYWAGKVPAAQFFGSVPFGMNAQQVNSWIYSGGGIELWEELYEQFNLIPIPAGSSGSQMGGWFNKEIKSVDDIKGLKMRIPGLGGKVISKAGGSAILSAGGEIYTNLERGVIDATEWVGPYHDYLMGFHKIAKFYYYPGWHEPNATIELFINKSAFNSLEKDLQEIIRTAAMRANLLMLAEIENKNKIYLQKLITEHKIQLRKFPDDVLSTLRKYSDEVFQELVERDAMSKRVFESYSKFQKEIREFAKVSEKIYYDEIS